MNQPIFRKIYSLFIIVSTFFIQSCSTSGPGLFARKSPHQQYGEKISEAGLKETALGRLWFFSAQQALTRPLHIELPYRETGYFPAEKPQSAGLRFTARRGEKLKITLTKKPADGFLIYMDLWQPAKEGTGNPKLLMASDTSGSALEYEVGNESYFILRLQPELLKGGEYTLNISTGPSLAFPVPMKAKAIVGSFWGAGRDNGARKHEGIDIFAPFRTPVVAADNGSVTRVEETTIGGKVVWLRPENRNISLYYAHLDSQLAVAGQRVRAGDTVGLMGKTGNAKSTSPHLHFGIYAIGGAVDPLPFVNPNAKVPAPVSASLVSLGKNLRAAGRLKLYLEPEANGVELIQLEPQTLITVKGATKNWYKVILPNGDEGFITSSAVTTINEPIRKASVKTPIPLLDKPDSLAPRMKMIEKGNPVNILAAYADFYYVGSGAVEGWIQKKAL